LAERVPEGDAILLGQCEQMVSLRELYLKPGLLVLKEVLREGAVEEGIEQPLLLLPDPRDALALVSDLSATVAAHP